MVKLLILRKHRNAPSADTLTSTTTLLQRWQRVLASLTLLRSHPRPCDVFEVDVPRAMVTTKSIDCHLIPCMGVKDSIAHAAYTSSPDPRIDSMRNTPTLAYIAIREFTDKVLLLSYYVICYQAIDLNTYCMYIVCG